MFTRREVVGAGVAIVFAGPAAAAKFGDRFVHRDGMRFTIDGKPYRYAGANMWYGAWLGADALRGDRARLKRELDALAAMGVTNLRVLASSGEIAAAQRGGARDARRARALRPGAAGRARFPAGGDGQAADARGAVPDQLLGMVGRDDDLSRLCRPGPLHQHERSGASLAGIPRLCVALLRPGRCGRGCTAAISARSSGGPTR